MNPPFNRLKKDHPLEAYSAAELGREFEGLTGKKADAVLGLVEKEASEENVRSLLHLAIEQANSLAPKPGTSASSTVTAPAPVQASIDNSANDVSFYILRVVFPSVLLFFSNW